MGIYNCASTLVEALDSLYSQTFQDFEVILCDDGSTDNTYEVASEYSSSHHNITLLKNDRNIKLAATLNRCLEHAKGEYVARMDGDDISLPDRFKQEVAFLDRNPEYSIVSCPMIYFDQYGEFARGRAIAEPKPNDFGRGTPFCHAPCMMRFSDLKEVGCYSTMKKVERMEDFYLWYKFYKSGYKGFNLQEHLYMMRDDRIAVRRRKAINRIRGIFVDIEVFRGLNLPIKYSIRSIAKNFIQVIIPTKLYHLLHARRINGQL